jgi:hypothetical protein
MPLPSLSLQFKLISPPYEWEFKGSVLNTSISCLNKLKPLLEQKTNLLLAAYELIKTISNNQSIECPSHPWPANRRADSASCPDRPSNKTVLKGRWSSGGPTYFPGHGPPPGPSWPHCRSGLCHYCGLVKERPAVQAACNAEQRRCN